MKFLDVTWYDRNADIPDADIRYVIIVARYKGQYAFVRHRSRLTWELPGGKREDGEAVIDAARRELFEETGAIDFDIEHVGYWSLRVEEGGASSGAVFCAEVDEFGELPPSEIAEMRFFPDFPNHATYPDVHPMIFERAQRLPSLICYLN